MRTGTVLRLVLRAANEPARRFRTLWHLVAWSCAGIFLGVGATYAVGSEHAVSGHSVDLVRYVEHSLRIHGAIMMAIALFLVYGINDYRRVTRNALTLMLFYSLWTASLLLGQHLLGPGTWSGFLWYLFVAVLTIGLLVLAPPLNPNGTRYRGIEEEEKCMSSSASSS